MASTPAFPALKITESGQVFMAQTGQTVAPNHEASSFVRLFVVDDLKIAPGHQYYNVSLGVLSEVVNEDTAELLDSVEGKKKVGKSIRKRLVMMQDKALACWTPQYNDEMIMTGYERLDLEHLNDIQRNEGVAYLQAEKKHFDPQTKETLDHPVEGLTQEVEVFTLHQGSPILHLTQFEKQKLEQ